MSDIHTRWGVSISFNEKWQALKSRLKLIMGTAPTTTLENARTVAFNLGKDIHQVVEVDRYTSDITLKLGSLINGASTPFELAKLLEKLFKTTQQFSEKKQQLVSQVVNESGCGIRLKLTPDGWLSYPEGEKLLDHELVEKPLHFLTNETLIEYKRALEHYNASNWEESSEKTRRTIEEYLRYKLKSSKGLEGSVNELGLRLKSLAGYPPHLKNTIIGILKILDKNYNEASKHNSKTYREQECEFLIYQVGLLMRLLEGVKFENDVSGAKK